jgi:hypothetical protein
VNKLNSALLVSCFILLGVASLWPVKAASHTNIVIGGLPKLAKSILDLRINEIHLQNITMSDALYEIEASVHNYSPRLYFSFGLNPTTSANASASSAPGHTRKLRDPKVRIDAVNITLREVINRLCIQSAWSYEDGTQIGIAFSDDANYFSKPTRNNNR